MIEMRIGLRQILIAVLAFVIFIPANAKLPYSSLTRSARIYLQEMPKNFKMAQQRLEEAIEQYPDEPPIEAYLLLGTIHAEKRRYTEMVHNFEIADSICAEFSEEDKDIKKTCESLDVQGKVSAIRTSQWIDEFNEGAQYLSQADEDMEALTDAEDEEEKLEILEDAETNYRYGLDNFVNAGIILPDSVNHWINLGITYYRISAIYDSMGTVEESHMGALKDSASASYEKALESHPDNVQLLQNLAAIYFEQQNWPKCSETFGRIATLEPDNAAAFQNLAMLLRQLDMSDSARVIIDKVIELDPDNIDMREQRGYLEVAHAAAINDSVITLKSEDEAANKDEIARLTEERNAAYMMVREDFSKVGELDPTNYDAWYYVGMSHYLFEEWEESIANFEKSVNGEPTSDDMKSQFADVYLNFLAPLYLKLGDAEKSREAQAKGEGLQGN